MIGTGGLQITDVNKNDDGNYVCRAENNEDSADASTTLEVHSKLIFSQIAKSISILK